MTEDEIDAIKKQIDEAASYRLWRLENNPNLIIGNYDADHLKAIHGYILQDSIEYYRAGEFREVVPEGYYHSKQRPAYPQGTEVFYSNNPSESIVNSILEPGLSLLKNSKNIEEFSGNMADIYAKLDYQHPFEEGNSRTLRYFTSLLAKEAGYELDWSKTGDNPLARIELYIARDSHILNTLYDFSPEYLAGLEKTDNTEFGKHKEHIENDIQGFFRQSSQEYNFRPLAKIIQDNTFPLERTQNKDLSDKLANDALRNNYPTLSESQLSKIELLKNSLLDRYTTPEARTMTIEHLYKQIPDIANGKIILPEFSDDKEKSKGMAR